MYSNNNLVCAFLRLLADVSVDVTVEEKRLSKGETWSVHKFGGTCVGNSPRIKNVAEIIINDDSESKLVVVSAMSKVTDMMYDLIHKAQSRDESYVSALDAVLEKHSSTALELLAGDDLAAFLSKLHQDINDLKAMLQAIYIGTLTFLFHLVFSFLPCTKLSSNIVVYDSCFIGVELPAFGLQLGSGAKPTMYNTW